MYRLLLFRNLGWKKFYKTKRLLAVCFSVFSALERNRLDTKLSARYFLASSLFANMLAWYSIDVRIGGAIEALKP